MDWFKRLLHGFKDDSGEPEDLIEYTQHSLPKSKQDQQEGPKDLNARIAYQYPKGRDGFPVVPEVKVQKPNRQSRKENRQPPQQKKQSESTQAPQAQRSQPLRTRLEKLRVVEEPKEIPSFPNFEDKPIQKVKPKKEKIRHGPFRPTEIPSPIYGYGRPRQMKVIEHELTGFIHGIDAYLDEESAVTLETPEVKEMETMMVEQVEVEEPDTLIEQVEEEELDTVVEQAEEEEPDTVVEQAEEEELDTVVEQAEEEELDILIEQVEEEELDTLIEQVEEEEPDTLIEQVEEEELDTVVEQADEEELDTLVAKIVAEKPSTLAEQVAIEKQAEMVAEVIQDEFDTDENVEASMDQETTLQEPVRKSHIPFNVLMLKQDKERLIQSKYRENKPFIAAGSEQEVQEPKAVLEEIVPEQQDTELSEEPIEEKETLLYFPPSENLLSPPIIQEENGEWLQGQEDLLNRTLADFNVGAKVVNVTMGPSVTRFEVQPDPGVKVNKITNLQDDIKLSLAAKDIRIEAPIPGKHTIGIEVPNQTSRPVLISEILNSPEFIHNSSPLTAALGLDISGKPVVTDLRKMPHGLIAWATGSGKSVCINSILTSLMYKADPQDVKLLLIDPKMVELAPYNHIPHLVSPVITDVKAATGALKWAVEEMERRYELFAHTGVREIMRFNELAHEAKQYNNKLPYILIVIDELADLMMVAPADVEEAVCRIAQKARACGIHLIIATQRPSVDVITGLIKANIPTRIAFSVSSQIDSRTIIDIGGAEKLLGRGDMLFLENGSSKPVRLQGTFISDAEIDRVVAHVRDQGDPEYLFEQTELIKKAQVTEEEDELFYEACEFIIEQGVASTSSLQRRFKIGYNRAARLIDMMHANGFISEAKGSKPRDVLITEEELDSFNSSSTIN
ncbi:DNA translocase FtsK [Bacillus sp. T3]|uniref:DNA translocase FtsK n=1 Tax=Bacillus sp. T3 TaxID=467262 RepID=UPI002980E6C0|nr:DNA translocase FtsK [Bacillus sp. T3]